MQGITVKQDVKKENTKMDLMNLLKLNLQFFSQDDTGGSNPSDDNPDDKKDNVPGDDPNDKKDKDNPSKDYEPKFTQEQVNKMIKERVNRAIKDKEEAVKEAEKLAKMNA